MAASKEAGWLARMQALSGTFKGFLLGFGIFALAFPLLLWNEGGAVLNRQSMEYGRDNPISVVSDLVQSVNDGRLVHMKQAELTPNAALADTETGQSFEVLKLQRQVEMYQWMEVQHVGEKLVATYAKVWSRTLIDSSKFLESSQYANPKLMPYTEREWTAPAPKLGAFRMPEELFARYNEFEVLPLTAEDVQRIPATLKKQAHVKDGLLHLTKDPAVPAVGAVRFRYLAVRPGKVSILAKQSGDTLAPFYTQRGHRVFVLRDGKDPSGDVAATLYAEATPGSILSVSTFFTWFFRAFAFAMFLIGIGMMLERIGLWGPSLPVIREMLVAGPTVFALVVATSFWLGTVGFAWLAMSWIGGGSLMIIGIAMLVALRQKGLDIQKPVVASGTVPDMDPAPKPAAKAG